MIFTSIVLAAGLQAASAAVPAFETEILAEGLDYPWSVAELPGGEILITEKSGQLRWYREGRLQDGPVTGVPDVLYGGQGGLLDIVAHPRFTENRLVYLTWSEGQRRDNVLALGRARFENGQLLDLETIFVSTPRRTDVHYGARLVFLGDGTILLGLGDGFDLREQAQVAGNHYGTFVHLDENGRPVASAIEDSAPGVFSIGHRNPQAVVVDPDTGAVYANEHGPQGGDEINLLIEGGNYGWPITSYGVDYTGALVTPFDTYPGMSEPILHWTPSIAPAGMAFYSGDMFPEWQGDLFVAALIAGDAPTASGHIRWVDLDDGQVVDQTVLLSEFEARFRDVRMASDGSLLAITDSDNGQLIRIYRD